MNSAARRDQRRNRIAFAGSLLFHGALAGGAALFFIHAPIQVEIRSIEVIADSTNEVKSHTSPTAPPQLAAHDIPAAAPPASGRTAPDSLSPSAASASTSSHAVNSAVNLYLSLIRDRIGASIRFPRGALLAPIRITLKLTLLPDGQVKAPALAQSSGRAEFDRSILDAVGRAGPFPHFTSEMSSFHELSVSLPIEIRPRTD